MSMPAAAALAVLAGVFVATQAAALGPLTRTLHPLVAGWWVQIGGVVIATALLLVSPLRFAWPGAGGGMAPAALGWVAVAGACAVGIVSVIGATVGTLGLATALAVITGAQLLLGLAVDATGIVGPPVTLTPARLVGVALVVAGVLLLLRPTPAA